MTRRIQPMLYLTYGFDVFFLKETVLVYVDFASSTENKTFDSIANFEIY